MTTGTSSAQVDARDKLNLKVKFLPRVFFDGENWHHFQVGYRSWCVMVGWKILLTPPTIAVPVPGGEEAQEVALSTLMQVVRPCDWDLVSSARTLHDALEKMKTRYVGSANVTRAILTSQVWTYEVKEGVSVEKIMDDMRDYSAKLRDAGSSMSEEDFAVAAITAIVRHFPDLRAHCRFLLGQQEKPLTLEFVYNSIKPLGIEGLTGKHVPGAFTVQAAPPPMTVQAIADATAAAVMAGQGNYRGGARDNNSKGVSKHTGSGNRTFGPDVKCLNCGGRRHKAYQCKKPCGYCNKYGHSKHKCNANPENANNGKKSGGGKGPRATANTAVSEPMDNQGEEAFGMQLQGMEWAADMPSPFLSDHGYVNASPVMHMASDGKKPIPPHKWILDGGASHHVTPCKYMLHDYKPSPGGRVKVADNTYLDRAGVGTLKVQTTVDGQVRTVVIENVWHVPKLGHSLLSVNALKDKGHWHTSRKGDMTEYFFDANDNLWLESPYEQGLNVPNWAVVLNKQEALKEVAARNAAFKGTQVMPEQKPQVASPKAQAAFVGYTKANRATDPETPSLWHQRLGHIPYDALSKLVRGGLIQGVKVPAHKFTQAGKGACEVCVMGKLRRAPFASRTDRADEPMHELHSDMSGPYQVESIGGGKYVITLLDAHSAFNAVEVVKTKAQGAEALKRMISEWETLTGLKCRKLYTDRGGEYINNALAQWCASKGIVHEFSVPLTPQENGKAERLNQKLCDMARSMLIQYNLYQPFWSFAMKYASLLCNYALNTRLNATPHQLFLGKVPDVSSLRTFGCKVLARIPDDARKKLDPKAVLGICLGPNTNGAGHKVLVYKPELKRSNPYAVHLYRDIVTYETLRECTGVDTHHELHWGGDIPFPKPQVPVALTDATPKEPLTGVPDDNILVPQEWRAQVLGSTQPRAAPHQVGASDQVGAGPSMGTRSRSQAGLTPATQAGPIPATPRSQIRPLETGQVPAAPMRPQGPHTSVERDLPSPMPDVRHVSGGGTHEPQGGIKRVGDVLTAQGREKVAKMPRETLVDDLMATFAVERANEGPVPVMTDVDPNHPPKSLKQAMATPFARYWAEAVVDEWKSLVSHGTWELVEREPSMKVIPCHWVFVVKTDADGKPVRFKARLVAGGNFQVEGIDFDETYAPVSRLATMRTLLAISARRGWKVHQIDVKTAFLHGDADTDVYMHQPTGFVDGTNMVCHLHKCLYGLKQAPRAWYTKLSELLRSLGFDAVMADTSFWVRNESGPDCVVVYLTTVVDDMLIVSRDESVTLEVVKQILTVFPGTHSGIASHYNGMRITWLPDERAVILSQTAHIEKMVAKFKHLVPDWGPRTLPMKDGLRLHKGGTSQVLESEPLDVQLYPFRSVAGFVSYVTNTTRPDGAFASNQLSKFSNDPRVAHWCVAVDFMRYLYATKDWGIMLGQGGNPGGEAMSMIVQRADEAKAFVDANHATGIDDKRSVSGYVLQVYGGPVSWASRTQQVTSTSSTESEYRALSDASKEVMWLTKILSYFDIRPRPFYIFGDSQGAIQALKNYSYTKHTKHIEIHHDFLRERYASGDMDFIHIPGANNPADIFTKALGKSKFIQFRGGLGMVDRVRVAH